MFDVRPLSDDDLEIAKSLNFFETAPPNSAFSRDIQTGGRMDPTGFSPSFSKNGCGMQKHDRADEFLPLYFQYSRRVYAFVRALIPNQSDAEDVFQEVSRTLWAKFDDYQSGTNFPAWAFSIARFKILQYRRSQSNRSPTLGDAVFELMADEVCGALSKEDARFQVLNDCLRKLPARDRHMIDVRYRQGQTTKSVAETVGRSVDAVYRSLRRIHKELFHCMQRGLVEER